jgi:urea carboxylase
MQAVRPDAPWCPSNIEFIRRVNGLSSIDDVYRIAFEASYLVLGLGDVYLGAPVATPIDPRHRLVTTKYNPARTWTPENAVGIGGAYLCVYGMEGPGGYQLIGRTVQVWNTFKTTKSFLPGFPWSLRFFDQIRFYPVSAEELLALRDAFPHGGFELKVENTDFNLKQYQTFLDSIQAEAASFKSHQKGAFDAERERWKVAGQAVIIEPPEAPLEEVVDEQLPEGYEAATSPITANVFQIAVEPGQTVEAGQKLVVLDAMKTELVVTASSAGRVREIRCATGKIVNPGQQLVVLQVQ